MAENRRPLDRINDLFKAVVEKAENPEYLKDDIETITRQLGRFSEYLDAWNKDVIGNASNQNLLHAGYIDTETFQYRRQSLDEQRRIAHDAMLTACSQLNRFCKLYGVEKFCPDPEKMHRSDIAQFAGMFVCETCGIDLQEKTLDMYLYDSAAHPEKTPRLDTDDLGKEFDRYIAEVTSRASEKKAVPEQEKALEDEVSI